MASGFFGPSDEEQTAHDDLSSRWHQIATWMQECAYADTEQEAAARIAPQRAAWAEWNANWEEKTDEFLGRKLDLQTAENILAEYGYPDACNPKAQRDADADFYGSHNAVHVPDPVDDSPVLHAIDQTGILQKFGTNPLDDLPRVLDLPTGPKLWIYAAGAAVAAGIVLGLAIKVAKI